MKHLHSQTGQQALRLYQLLTEAADMVLVWQVWKQATGQLHQEGDTGVLHQKAVL